MRCRHCRRLITNTEVRDRSMLSARDEPGYDEPGGGCLSCSPTFDDLDRMEDQQAERRTSELREDA